MIGKKKRQVLALMAFASFATVVPTLVSANTLIDEYNKSLSFDALYLQAKADYNGAKESTLSAWSSFFPQVSASGNLLNNYSEQLNNSFSVNVRQTVFNWSAIRQVSVANAQVQQAVDFLSASEQDLMQRVANGYFAVVRAHELVRVMERQLEAMTSQLHAVHERYNVGHATVTDLDRVQANYDLYRSQLVTVKMNLSAAKQALSEMTGDLIQTVPRLKDDFKPVAPVPLKLSVWQDKVTQGNLSVKTANQAMVVAKEGIGVKRGGYFPTLSLSGSYYPDKYYDTGKNLIYGLSVSFNAFQGGYTFAEVGKAQAAYQKTAAKRDAALRSALSMMNNSYNGMLEGVEQIEAEKLAVGSNQSALKNTEKGYIAGTQTILDVLDQQNKLFEAERTYVEGRINYLNSVVSLELAAGTLKPVVLAGIQAWFADK